MKRRFSQGSIYSINVTPIVDVMLVLLVVFMITTPLLISGIDVNLPESESQTLQDIEDPLVITIDQGERIFIHETEFSLHNFKKKIENIGKQNKNMKVLVRGDKNVSYGKVVELMGILYKSNLVNISILSNVEKH